VTEWEQLAERVYYAQFRTGVLIACQSWARPTARLFELFNIDRHGSTARHAMRCLAWLCRKEFLRRDKDGYRTTAQGFRLLADLHALHLDDTGDFV
jgi:hypothetical protein